MASLKQVWQELVDPGKDARNKYNDTLQQQINTAETDRQNFATNTKNLSNQNTGYLNNYLSSLYQLPQLNFNSGVTQLKRGIADSEKQINKTLANRGITSGVDVKALANSRSALAKGVSQLQGQMYRDNADINNTAYNAVRQNNANDFSMMQSAYNYNPTQGYMNQYLNQLNAEGQQQGILPQLVGTVANAYLGNWAGAAGNLAGMGKTISNNMSAASGSNIPVGSNQYQLPMGDFVGSSVVDPYRLSYSNFQSQMAPNYGTYGSFMNNYSSILRG